MPALWPTVRFERSSRAAAEVTTNVPERTPVPPLYELVPESTIRPEPLLISVAAPLIGPLSVKVPLPLTVHVSEPLSDTGALIVWLAVPPFTVTPLTIVNVLLPPMVIARRPGKCYGFYRQILSQCRIGRGGTWVGEKDVRVGGRQPVDFGGRAAGHNPVVAGRSRAPTTPCPPFIRLR